MAPHFCSTHSASAAAQHDGEIKRRVTPRHVGAWRRQGSRRSGGPARRSWMSGCLRPRSPCCCRRRPRDRGCPTLARSGPARHQELRDDRRAPPQIGAGLSWCSGLRAGSQNPAARRAWRARRWGQIGDKRCQLGNSASETDWRASVRDDCPSMTVDPCCAGPMAVARLSLHGPAA